MEVSLNGPPKSVKCVKPKNCEVKSGTLQNPVTVYGGNLFLTFTKSIGEFFNDGNPYVMGL